MKKSTISYIILFIILTIALGSGLWTFVLRDPLKNLTDDLLHKERIHEGIPSDELLLDWILENKSDSLEYAVKVLKNEDPQLSRKIKRYLRSQPNSKNKLFAKVETPPSTPTIEAEEIIEHKSPAPSEKQTPDIKDVIEAETEKSSNLVSSTLKHLKFKVGNNSVYYTGDIVDGKAMGTGKGIFDNGLIYEGTWINNKLEGKGTLKWPDGSVYEGSFSNNVRTGTGTHISKNQEKYVGEWLNDYRHGEGTLYDKKGKIKYKGEWKSDIFIP